MHSAGFKFSAPTKGKEKGFMPLGQVLFLDGVYIFNNELRYVSIISSNINLA